MPKERWRLRCRIVIQFGICSNVSFQRRGSHGTGNNSITLADLISQDVFTPALETEVWPRTPESEEREHCGALGFAKARRVAISSLINNESSTGNPRGVNSQPSISTAAADAAGGSQWKTADELVEMPMALVSLRKRFLPLPAGNCATDSGGHTGRESFGTAWDK